MSNDVTTVTLPRDLFDKVAQLAKRDHRSTRGQIMHILSAATAGIELPADVRSAPLTRQELKAAELEAERKGSEASDELAAKARELEALFSNRNS